MDLSIRCELEMSEHEIREKPQHPDGGTQSGSSIATGDSSWSQSDPIHSESEYIQLETDLQCRLPHSLGQEKLKTGHQPGFERWTAEITASKSGRGTKQSDVQQEKEEADLSPTKKNPKVAKARLDKESKYWIRMTQEMEKREQAILDKLEEELVKIQAQENVAQLRLAHEQEFQDQTQVWEENLQELSNQFDDLTTQNQNLKDAYENAKLEAKVKQGQVEQAKKTGAEREKEREKQNQKVLKATKKENLRELKSAKELKLHLEKKLVQLQADINQASTKADQVIRDNVVEVEQKSEKIHMDSLAIQEAKIQQLAQWHAKRFEIAATEDLLAELKQQATRESAKEIETIKSGFRVILDRIQRQTESMTARQEELEQDLEDMEHQKLADEEDLRDKHTTRMNEFREEIKVKEEEVAQLEQEQKHFQELQRDREVLAQDMERIRVEIQDKRTCLTGCHSAKVQKMSDLAQAIKKSSLPNLEQILAALESDKKTAIKDRAKDIQEICKLWETKDKSQLQKLKDRKKKTLDKALLAIDKRFKNVDIPNQEQLDEISDLNTKMTTLVEEIAQGEQQVETLGEKLHQLECDHLTQFDQWQHTGEIKAESPWDDAQNSLGEISLSQVGSEESVYYPVQKPEATRGQLSE